MSLKALPPEVMKAFLRQEMENAEWIDFDIMGMWTIVDEAMLREFKEKINWQSVFHHIQCSEEFIRELLDDFYGGITMDSMYLIITNQHISEKFLNEIREKINWYNISSYKNISEEFIERWKEDLDWWEVSRNPHLPLNILIKYEDRLRWNYVLEYNQNLTEELKEKHKSALERDTFEE